MLPTLSTAPHTANDGVDPIGQKGRSSPDGGTTAHDAQEPRQEGIGHENWREDEGQIQGYTREEEGGAFKRGWKRGTEALVFSCRYCFCY